MNNHTRFILSAFLINLISAASFAKVQESLQVTPFTLSIHKRFYVIARLERLVKLIYAYSNENKIALSQVFNFSGITIFSHRKILETIEDIQKNENIEAVSKLWREFITYKYPFDENLMSDITRFFFVVAKNLLVQTIKKTNNQGLTEQIDEIFYSSLKYPPTKLIEIIDLFVDDVVKENKLLFNDGWQTHTDPLSMANPIRMQLPVIEAAVIPEFVTKRYYLTQRLAKALNIVVRYISINHSSLLDLEIIARYSWKDDYIQSICQEILSMQSMAPILGLWDYFTQFRKIHDLNFNREACILILISLHCLDSQFFAHARGSKNNWLSDVESLPLEEILNTIDLLVEQMPAILEKYEFQSNLSWKEWFRKYWWALPLISTIIGLRLLITYKDLAKLIGKTN